MNPQRPLASFVKTQEVDTSQWHVQWHEVRRRVRRHRQVRVASAVVAALLVAGVVAGLVLRRPEPRLLPGQTLGAGSLAQTQRLVEGSEISVTPGGEVQLLAADDAEVVLLLERGRAAFDVEKRPTRRFVVKADSVEVRVVGTKFTVEREGRHVEVSVLRGVVEVREGDVVTRLERGQRWSRQSEVEAATDPVTPPTSPLPPTEEKVGERFIAPSVTELKQEHPRQRPTPTPTPTPAAAAPEPMPEPLPPATPSTDPTPAETFALAMRARAAGHATEAIRSFQQVCERWPSSAYAPMSAFEWGRLALDTQADPRQAARAFERTLELATSASLIEDALARLAEAYARYDVGSCRRVQAEYLRRFPEGPHVRGVTKACPP